jgi:hypothetical protein
MNPKSPIALALVLVAAILAVLPATTNAQSSDSMIVEIPFSFVVGKQELPAGDYVVSRAAGDAIQLASRDGESAVVAIAGGRLRANSYPSKGKLVFRSYEGRYHLSQVWARAGAGREISAPGTSGDEIALLAR